MKLPVPYYSQYLDISDPFWMPRGCGATDFAMIVEALGTPKQDILAICKTAKEEGGYDMSNGWVHDYIVKKAQELGFEAYRKEGLTSIDELISSLDAGNPVLVSVEKRVLEQRKFHTVVLVGYEKSESAIDNGLSSIDCLYYHESEKTDSSGAYRPCDVATFMQYWRGKAIFISKPKSV